MVMASEVGVYDTEPENVALKVRILTILVLVVDSFAIESSFHNQMPQKIVAAHQCLDEYPV